MQRKITPDARQDILGIYTYTVREWGVNQAQAYIDGLEESLNTLAKSPAIGRRRPEFDGKSRAYSYLYKEHVIYYGVKRDYIVIVAVLGGKMNHSKHLKGRSED